MLKNRLFPISLLIIGIAIIAHTLFLSGTWQRRLNLQEDLDILTQNNQAAEETAREIRSQIDALRHRKEYQEHVVRDELGYVRKGDFIIELDAQSQ